MWPAFNTTSTLPGRNSQTFQRLHGLVSITLGTPNTDGNEICLLLAHFAFCKLIKNNHYLLFLKTFLVYSIFSYICTVLYIYRRGWQGSIWGTLISDRPWKRLRWALTPQQASAKHVFSVSVAHVHVNCRHCCEKKKNDFNKRKMFQQQFCSYMKH